MSTYHKSSRFTAVLVCLSWHSRQCDSASVRPLKMHKPIFIHLDMLDRVPAAGIADVNLSVGRLDHAGVGILARVRFQMQRALPRFPLIQRAANRQRGPAGLRIVEN